MWQSQVNLSCKSTQAYFNTIYYKKVINFSKHKMIRQFRKFTGLLVQVQQLTGYYKKDICFLFNYFIIQYQLPSLYSVKWDVAV